MKLTTIVLILLFAFTSSCNSNSRQTPKQNESVYDGKEPDDTTALLRQQVEKELDATIEIRDEIIEFLCEYYQAFQD